MKVKNSLKANITLAGIMLFGIINFAIAQDNRVPQKGIPPREAITACQNKDVGEACSMETPQGDIVEGICKYTPDNKYFVCIPEGGPQMPPKRK